jgi:hypothetical protein
MALTLPLTAGVDYPPSCADYVSRIADDEDIMEDYVPQMRAEDWALADYVEEWSAVRGVTIALLRNLPSSAWSRRGVANEHPISVQPLAYAIVGHVRHHLEVLDSRYE